MAHPAAARQVGLAPRLLHLLDEPLAAPAELSHTGRRLGRLDDEEPLPSGKQRTAVAKARYAAAAKAKRAAQRDAEEEAKRAEERDAVGDREENILEAIHDASGSTIRTNSRRYSTLGPGPARDEAKRDIEADIERYVKVDIEHQAACGTTPRVPTCRCSCAAAAGCATPTRPRRWRRTAYVLAQTMVWFI